MKNKTIKKKRRVWRGREARGRRRYRKRSTECGVNQEENGEEQQPKFVSES
jgi:hypothetical protein